MTATTMVPTFAATQATPVTYDNRNVTPGDDTGVWGVIVPTAITFTDDSRTGDAAVELTGLKGYSLEDFGEDFSVAVTVKSANGYQLTKGDKTADYSLTYGDKVYTKTDDVEADKTDKEVAALTKVAAKQEGTATLTTPATEKGTYKDTLTYTFTGTGTVLK